MIVQAWSASRIRTDALPGRAAVLRIADTAEQLVPIADAANIVALLDLVFNDASDSYAIVKAPTRQHAELILDFVARSTAPYFIAQCQVGVGRSKAVAAAILKLRGQDPNPILQGTYNRKLYALLLDVAGIPLPPDRLISMVVRVKYAADRLNLLLLSLQRQRHDNWEAILVTDGPNPDARALLERLNEPRARLIETPEPKGRWGHPYRQLGLDACNGQYIGMTNDDNYYVPGYFDQMLFALREQNGDLVACPVLHSYDGWNVTSPGSDLGSWLASAELIRKVPWHGEEFDSDRQYLLSLMGAARLALQIKHPLFVHN